MKRNRHRRAFSLLEVLTATTLLVVLMAVTASVVDNSSKVMRQANAKIESFQAARAVFDIMTQRLSQATLNTYWDYYNSSHQAYRSLSAASAPGFIPASYGRVSDLHFVCGQASGLIPALPEHCASLSTQAVFFACPTGLTAVPAYAGLPGLLTACGYFVAFGSDETGRPSFLHGPTSWRWRLMELSVPTENLNVFSSASGTAWLTQPIQQNNVRPVADNIIALILWPRLSSQDDSEGTGISTDYGYDSRTTAPWVGTPPRQPVQAHQLPPSLQITMVAIDEAAAKKLENGSTPPAQIGNALSGLFQNDVKKYEEDLGKLEMRLTGAGIPYRIFTTTITLKEAKWAP